MKAVKQFSVVLPGDIYPTTFEKGDEIPKEAEENAIAMGAAFKRPAKKASK